jgi:hypothetical protein
MMKKKGALLLILMVCMVGSVFAAPEFKLSVGVGGLGIISDSQDIYWYGGSYGLTNINGGAYAFFDATYGELSLGISGGPSFMSLKYPADPDIPTYELSRINFNIGILGKYPFELTKKFFLFPLLGFNYSLALSIKTEDGEKYDKPSDFSEFWLQAGLGLDWLFIQNFYLRFTPLLGFRLPTKYEKNLIDTMQGHTERASLSFTARLAVGFRF